MDWSDLARPLQQHHRLDVSTLQQYDNLAKKAEGAARYVAQHLDERDEIAVEITRAGLGLDDVWTALRKWWEVLAKELDPVGAKSSDSCTPQLALAVALGKLERNLIAGHECHQRLAASHEPHVRQVIFDLTTFARIEDPEYFTAQAILTQLLVNLVSPVSAEAPSEQKAEEHLRRFLSGRREDDVIIRLLDSADIKVNMATLHLLANLTGNSVTRLRLLLEPAGLQWCTRILVRMDEWHKSADDGRFELACGIFNPFIVEGMQAELFGKLAAPGEPVTPSELTLLKLLDSSLSASSSPSPFTMPEPLTLPRDHTPPNMFLIPLFHLFSAYALNSIRSKADDGRLPLVFEALVLVSECLCSIGLRLQARRDARKHELGEQPMGDSMEETRNAESSDAPIVAECKAAEDGHGIIKPLVELLSALNEFLPRVKPGTSPPAAAGGAVNPLAPLAGLKRNLVQLLGILSFGDTQVGDQARSQGGVQLVLGMTEVDESNPFLREHALFCVRNLMLNNPANQAVIAEMDPVGVISETGELLPLPERMRRQRQTQSSSS